MKLSGNDKKQLRRLGHQLNPVVTVASKGLNDNVLAEIDRALTDHELIKVKIVIADRDAKKQVTLSICKQLAALEVQTIGHVVLLLRKSGKPNLKLSNLLRQTT